MKKKPVEIFKITTWLCGIKQNNTLYESRELFDKAWNERTKNMLYMYIGYKYVIDNWKEIKRCKKSEQH